MSDLSRRALGREGEQIAWDELARRGYRLVKRNHHGGGGEVDIIAWDGETLCFIEVRARQDDSFGDPLETIDARKIARIGRAAYHYLEGFSGPWPPMRFDAVGIILGPPRSIHVVQGAFEL